MTNNGSEGWVHALARACKGLRDLLHARMEAIGLPRGQGMILRRIGEEEGLPQTELAQRAMIRAATLTRLLQRLEQAGLVERRPDPRDQRMVRVFLTAHGRAKLRQVQAIWQDIERDLSEVFTPQERQTLVSLLARLEERWRGER